MRIFIATPRAPRSRTGNGVTASRWTRILRDLGHDVRVAVGYDGADADLLIALHALKSARALLDFHDRFPQRPVICALTGTDLYHDLATDRLAQHAVQSATHLVVLNDQAIEALTPAQRRKATVIFQSVERRDFDVRPLRGCFEVAVVANLRPVKDPLRTAHAVRHLPAESRMHVTHYGAALDSRSEAAARRESDRNDRYDWRGSKPRAATLRLIARASVLCSTSKLEGGSNVIAEAVVYGTPVLSSDIAGSVGMLGADYPGYFPTGDTAALRALVLRAEQDPKFYRSLARACRRRARLFAPQRERAAWRRLLHDRLTGSNRAAKAVDRPR